ncbi:MULTISPECIES: PTS system mannose/fructose/sorbose family transporter subunit IID [unclassified Fusobacterium]|uniref:PTS system mannose/fructose/sorbose family transporter subunit IID n=1 Tax=Fusobacterium sp. TaxID=68766 RepID=UPI0025C2AC33|nr:PTS system mannose/fructose/sorbose family transporter subunit IID [Fusobacterium sp.]
MESKNMLTKKDYIIATIRAHLLQSAFNYTEYQGVGYLNIILPGLKKIYKNDQEKLKEVAIANLEFYNTNPQTIPFITSLQLAMYQDGQSAANVRSIKMALMGPLSGIGDSISQFGLAPLFSTIFAGLALSGLGFAPLGYLFAMISVTLMIKLFLGFLGYKLGTKAIKSLSDKIGEVSEAANIVGVTVISALAAKFVKAKLAVQYVTEMTINGQTTQKIVSFQEVLDQILPSLLPIAITGLVLYLLKKKKWNTYRLLILLFTLGIALSALGILK